MKKDKFKNQRGEIVTAVILIISVISLGVSTTKVGQYAIDRHHSDQIAQSLKEQSQYLSQKATKLGKSGDEAVKESLRLNEASKDIEEHGLQVFSEKASGESVNMAIGGLIGQAGGVGQAINTVMDVDGILKSNADAWSRPPTTGDDKKLAEIIQGSKENIDDFNLAWQKAMIDDIARARGEVKAANDYLDQLLKAQEENEAKWKKWEEERAKLRLGAIQKEEIKKEYEEAVQKTESSGMTVYVKNLIGALSKKPTKTPTTTPTPKSDSGSLKNRLDETLVKYCAEAIKTRHISTDDCLKTTREEIEKTIISPCLKDTGSNEQKCYENAINAYNSMIGGPVITSTPQDQTQTQSGGLDNTMLDAFKIYCEFGEKKYGTDAKGCIQKNMDDYKKAYQQCLTVMTKEKCEEMLSKSAEGYRRAPEFF